MVITEAAVVSPMKALSSPVGSLHFRVEHCHRGSLHLIAYILDFTLQVVKVLDGYGVLHPLLGPLPQSLTA